MCPSEPRLCDLPCLHGGRESSHVCDQTPYVVVTFIMYPDVTLDVERRGLAIAAACVHERSRLETLVESLLAQWNLSICKRTAIQGGHV